MTITVTQEQVYLGVIVFLCILQMLQWAAIKKLEKECSSLWEQMRGMATTLVNTLDVIKKELDKKENKKHS